MYNPGLGDTGAYLISGYPWLSGSGLTGSDPNNGEVKFSFPKVAKGFTVINTGTTALYVHFVSRATTSDVIDRRHFLELNGSEDSFGFYARAKEVYVSMKDATEDGEVSIFAELTSIPASQMHALSGSGVNE
jgi:hypothetical protein